MGDNDSQTFVEKMLKEIDDRRDVLAALREINHVLDSSLVDSEKVQKLIELLTKRGLR